MEGLERPPQRGRLATPLRLSTARTAASVKAAAPIGATTAPAIDAATAPGVGALVVNASADKLSQRGLVFHDEAEATQLRTQSVEGALYIGDTLFTKSPDIIKASGLADLEGLATVFLK